MRIVFAVLAALVMSGACAASLDVIPGTVSSFEPRGANMSQSPEFGVYFTTIGYGVTQTVVTDRTGKLLFSTVTSGDTVKVMPVGSLSSKVNIDNVGTGMKDGVITCPCHSVTIYDDGPNGTVIVIYDSNNNIAQVITMPPRAVQK